MDTTTSIKMTTLAIQNLFSYVEEENLAALKAHLDRFKEVDGRSDNGQTPLMLAAEQGSLEIVQELVRRGANVNLDDVDCWSALISAAKEGHVDVVKELLENSAYIEHRDMGGWTALMWAAYKGRVDVTELLLEHGANPNTTGQQYSVYPIIWAAGRGHADIVKVLLNNGAKVNCSDKYGTTPLIWASRKGHFDCVMHLLENGADVDQEGANSMTALIVAVKGGYTEVVKELLKRNPNVNMTDKDGNTALMIAAKEGYTEIVQDLLDAGTYVNIPDRSGDTVLIGAVRGGHVEIVRALLHKYADIDIRGQENKTALYWAVEKGNATMVRDILQCNPDTETCTKDGETPLIKATKMRNIEIVELLLDKGAKVSAVDKKGDTPLHIAIRGRSRRLAELLLRNPKDGRLLYRPNKAGETPYNIDCSHQKSILTQIFGARHLSPTESDGDMLGYDLYSSALADILSEPTMQPPICVGLYAQWGSGKSFLLKKLEDEMKTFAGQQIEPLFQFSWLVVFLSLLLCGSIAIVLGFTVDPKLSMAVSLSLLALLYLFFVVVYFGGRREGESWNWAWLLSTRLARHIGYLELLLKLMFVNPPELPEQSTRALPVRFLFTDYNRLSSVGGETSMAEMIATLSDACEREFGFLATRLFRVFKTEESQGKRKWKKTCCVPSFIIFVLVLSCLLTGMALLAVFKVDGENQTVNAVLIAIGSVVGLALLLNCRTWWQVTDSVLNSQRKRLHSAANRMHKLKSEGFMKVLKNEVELMARMAKTIDGFTQHQTRLAVVIDGLDSCEQDKVLQMLDTVRVLFSKGPFISIFASDPHIIIKAINQNLNSVLRDSNINGHDYMRNIVHLPVFLNSRGLSSARKMCAPAPANGDAANTDGWHEELDRKLSQHSLGELTKFGSKTTLNRRDTYRRRQVQRSVTRQMSFDLTKLMVTEDWFSDISPQTMRRLLNIVSVTGRLLRANQISFNWDRLASWINLTEQWPYRTSWLILYLEETDGVPDQATLKTIYERVSKNIPTTKDVEPLLEIDGDVRSFEVFLSSRTPVLTARDIRTFLPCTVNLDPKLREIIADVRAAREQMNMGGVTYPALPLQEPQPRPTSVYSQVSSACSPSASFGGPFNQPAGGVVSPQPHSSYYSGMAGPQHPFYNRPYFPHHLYQLPRPLMAPSYPSHLHPRPLPKAFFSRDASAAAGSASVVSGAPAILLSSMTTEAVCERVRQIEGIDQSMMGQYAATIRKANVNGRVLSQCNIDELKKEMSMNFGDWQLFRATVLDMRQIESQVLQDEVASEQGSVVGGPTEAGRRAVALPHAGAANADGSPMYSFNLSFEELSTIGLDDPARHGHMQWMGGTHRTASMTSLNSQESSNDIGKLTDKQQAEYRNAYQEYIAQMSQLEMGGSGAERPVQPQPSQFMTSSSSDDKGKDGGEQDGRKSFNKRSSGKPAADNTDFASNGDGLDPITEEDEKGDHGSSKSLLTRKTSAERGGLFQGAADLKLKAGGGLRYQKLTSDDEESEESDNAPLLKDGKKVVDPKLPGGSLALKGKDYLSDAMLDKKDSSDSGVRSNESSPNHSLQDEEADLSQLERANLIELDEETLARKRCLPSSLSGLQDPAIARMSICSEDQCSLLASSPEESWPSSKSYNLNRTPSNVTLNNNTNAQQGNHPRQPAEGSTSSSNPTSTSSSSDVILSPSSGTTSTSSSTTTSTRPGPNNENVRVVHLKRGLKPGDPPEICTVSSDTVTFGEERESIL
ncbi:kinase D-interacting substrate of 220 kDa B isoform X1 [Acanthopagrus latus]|uniref:kinase D-interacting substrate of 220 kDa B isoform X1 n=1 Tax=Acanthopagrus latus TaxID=8177 RepID=UPI00187D06D6|nr:kinase D-interacting substrate of 220 kDa B isoform X1 [Acanthopagrus latus]XP_036941659.1 kinase D-interacting substrate of 220 kDa B isoform X1 [Acanthopagrus latus]XP_036941661.1 kinase D-interacting substrate of 220 kDa B isoform X1 [Acanthopagrus latus]